MAGVFTVSLHAVGSLRRHRSHKAVPAPVLFTVLGSAAKYSSASLKTSVLGLFLAELVLPL